MNKQALAFVVLPMTATANPNLAGPGIPGLGLLLVLVSLFMTIVPFWLLYVAYKRAKSRTLTRGKMYLFLAPAIFLGVSGLVQTVIGISDGIELEALSISVFVFFVGLDIAYLTGGILVYRKYVENLAVEESL